MKMKGKQILSLLLCAAMALTMLPTVALAAPNSTSAIRLDAENHFGIAGGANWVYFGESNNAPVKWRVLSTALNGDSWMDSTDALYTGRGLFMLSEDLLGTSIYNNTSYNGYYGSTLQSWSNNDLYNSIFNAAEQTAVLRTEKGTDAYVGVWDASELYYERLFSLSGAEATNSDYGFSSNFNSTDSSRQASNSWWLRSPILGHSDNAGAVTTNGLLTSNSVGSTAGVRPAFNLKLNSILFASAAAGGKSEAGTNSGLTAVPLGDTPDEWKLTLLDSTRSFDVTTTNLFSHSAGGSVSVDYTCTTAGTNEYVSAMLVDGGGDALYYGRLKAVAGDSDLSGTVDIAIPSGLPEGSYTLKVFSEQYNGDQMTDYASAFQNVTLTVDNTPHTVSVTPGGTGIPISTDQLSITFSEAMDTGTTGTVAIDNGATVQHPQWSNGDKTVTYTLSGLAYSQTYAISISGFKSAAGYEMAADTSHSFTAEVSPVTPSVSTNTLVVGKGDQASFTVAFGQGSAAATNASITVGDGNVASVSRTQVATSSAVTVTGLSVGTTDITVAFNDTASTTKTVTVTVLPLAAIRLDADNHFGIVGGGTNWIYFGKNSSMPVKWRVLSTTMNGEPWNDRAINAYTGKGLFLFSEDILGTSIFNGPDNRYYGSTLQSWSNDNLCNNVFNTVDQTAVLQTVKPGGLEIDETWSTSMLWYDRLFSLSVAEATNSSYGFSDSLYSNDPSRQTGATWWLRSFYRYNSNTYTGAVNSNGFLINDLLVGNTAAVRPAFNLKLDAVLFASAAAGGKSAAGMDNRLTVVPVAATAPTEWKLTLLNNTRSFVVNTTNVFVHTAGGSVSVDYTGATAGTNEYISAMIVDDGGNDLYYGRLKAVAGDSDTSGTLNIAIPSGLAEGRYTLKVFSEQYNGDNETDYASAFQNVTLTVDNAPHTVSVTPDGTEAPISTDQLSITFSEAMDTGTAGTIALDNGATVQNPQWSNGDKTVTYTLSGLAYVRTYAVSISGFKSAAGNTMAADTSHSFTTQVSPVTPSVSPDTLTVVDNRTASFTVAFGQGSAAATNASITVGDGSIASVSQTQVATSGAVTVTGLSAGTTDITVAFNDTAGTTKTVSVTVQPAAAIQLDAGSHFGIEGGGTNWVYFGGNSNMPVRWRVLSTTLNGDSWKDNTDAAYTGSGLFMLSEDLLGTSKFNSTAINTYDGSTLQAWSNNFYNYIFNAGEQAAVLQSTKHTDSDAYVGIWNACGLDGDRLFSLSAAEATNSGYGFSSDSNSTDSARQASSPWWLRSSRSGSSTAAGRVSWDGYMGADSVTINNKVRPAFNLKLDSVLFASAAAGGKSAAGTDSGLTAVSLGAAPDEWKLTLLDGTRNFEVTTTNVFAPTTGGSVSIHYSGATAGTNEYISAMLVDGGNALYYGRLKAVAGAADGGALDIAIPSGLAEGSYTLKVFSEQYNGSQMTDYASAFQNVALTVDNDPHTTPTVSVASITVSGTSGVSSVQVGNTLQMLAAILPSNAANQDVIWNIESGSGASIDTNGLLTATAAGSVTVRATAQDGSGVYGETMVTLTAQPPAFVPVTSINGVPTAATVGTNLTLSGTVAPVDATNKTIVWSVKSAGGTGATISGNTLSTTAPGAVTVTATITNGLTASTNYTQDFTITVSVVPVTDDNPNTGGGGGGGSTPSTYNADVNVGKGAETTLPVTVNKDTGNASIEIGSQSSLVSGGVAITIPSIPGVDTYSIGISVTYLSTADGQGALTVNTNAGSITIPSNMLAGVSGISGNKSEIAIGQGDKASLSEDVRAAIGDRPLIQLSLAIEGKQIEWNNPNAPVTISIPYTPTASELANPESIIIWYIDGSGNAVSVPNGRYDPATGTVTFATTHFSDYAVVYNNVSFSDVAAGAWYKKAVSFVAARDITTGTGNGNYSPEKKLTRGQFLVMVMRAYGIKADENAKDNFSDAGNTYYTGYLAAAKKLGITDGIGNNLFAPKKEITRQEMFTLLYNTLESIGELPSDTKVTERSAFTDTDQIASWAEDAMTLFVKTGTVSGSNGMLSPADTTTRAEMAQVLYNLLSKQ